MRNPYHLAISAGYNQHGTSHRNVMKRCAKDGFPIAMLVPEIYDTKVLVSVQNIF